MVLRALHLCSGYAGFELALRLAGIPARTVAHVERDAYAAATLVARMADQALDQAPVWSDLVTFDGAAWRGRVDLVTAGFPCQPFSQAGQRKGIDDERWLWPDIERIVGDVQPSLVFLENVPGLVGAGLLPVLEGLAVLGFDAEWGLLSAAAVGAPHRRARFWLLAYTDSPRREGRRVRQHEPAERHPHVADASGLGGGAGLRPDPHQRSGGRDDATSRSGAWPPGPDDLDGWAEWIAEGGPQPQVRRSVDGRPVGLADALHLGGNGLVPRVAAAALVELARRAGVRLT